MPRGRKIPPSLTTDEQKELQAELLRCADDLEYFCRRWIKIPADRGIVPFVWNPSQHKIHAKLREYRRLMILKIRQLAGITTYMAARNLHSILFNEGENVLIVAQDDTAAVRIGAVYRSMYESLPDWMRRELFAITKPQDGTPSDRFTEFSNHSSWQVHSAGSKAIRSAAGITRQHLSEQSHWDDPVWTMGAVGQTSVTVTNPEIVSETTANGPNWYYDAWEKTDPKKGGYAKLFLTWLGDSRCVACPAKATTEWEKELQAQHGLTPEQLGWVIRTRDTLCGTMDSMFDQEYPTTEKRAFVLSGRPFFPCSYEDAYAYLESAEEAPVWVGAEPAAGHVYVVGADTASGAPWPSDASAAVVLDATEPGRMPVVCTVRVREPQVDFAKRVVTLARSYNKATVVPETSLGLTLVDELKSARGIRIYRQQVFDKAIRQWTEDLGWETTAQSRPLLLGRLHAAVASGQVDPQDIRLKAELNAFRYGRSRPEAAPGKHDDLVMALGMAIMGLQQVGAVRQEVRRKRPRNWEEAFRAELRTGREYNRRDPVYGGTGLQPIVPQGFHGY